MCIAYTIYLISCMCNFWWESICPQLCHNLSLLEEDHLCCLNTKKKNQYQTLIDWLFLICCTSSILFLQHQLYFFSFFDTPHELTAKYLIINEFS